MAKGSNVAGVIIGSVLITLILVAAGGYFVLPLVFPNIKAENEDENILLQSKFIEFDDQAEKNDTVSDFELLNGTQTSITIEEDSKIAVSFSFNYFMLLDATMWGTVWWDISLVIEGVSNSTHSIVYSKETATGDYLQFSNSLYFDLMSNELSNGTYDIAVYWRSTGDRPGSNFIFTWSPSLDLIRTLWVLELR